MSFEKATEMTDKSSSDDVQVLTYKAGEQVSEGKVLAKIDFRVLSALMMLYILAFLDRVNIGNAALFGLKDDLRLRGDEYNTALVIFFVPYVVFDIPCNMLMKHFKPHVWLSGCMFLFGLVTCLQGLTQNYSGLLATRFFLGLLEAGMFPGCFYLLAMWYRRTEAQKRCTMFFGSNNIAGAFGGLLASAIGKMDGMRGLRGWRWVFILEGILTCIISVFLFFWIADFPEEVKWLSPTEKDLVKRRLQEDVGESQLDGKITWKFVLKIISEPKVIIGGFMYLGLIVPAYGYAYFAPTIIQGLGHGSIQSQLLSVPTWASAFLVSMIVAYFSDRLKHRYLFTVASMALALAGFIILIAVNHHTNLKYGALYLASAGTYSAMPVVLCWFSTNLAGHRRRAVAIAWQIGFGNIGGIIASYAFLAQDAPRYFKGYGLCIAFIGFSAFSCTAYLVSCIWDNRRREQESADSRLTWEEKQQLGDMNPDYRYLL